MALPSSRGNLLLIQADQWNPDCLGILGHPNVRTPHLDRLARQGALFREAVCQSPICMPSRISMLSGQYVSTTRQFGFFGTCDVRMPWMARTFREAGYRTAAFGKFHTLAVGADQWGFEVAAPSLAEDHDLARPAGIGYREYCRARGISWPHDQIHGHNPFGGNPPVSSAADPAMTWARQRACPSDVPLEHSLETWTTDRLLEFLRDPEAQAAPFFAWLSYDRPHNPTTLPPEWMARVDPEKVVLPRLPTAEEVAAWPSLLRRQLLASTGNSLMGSDAASFRYILATYFTLIEWIDAEIGRVMQGLAEADLDEATTVIFTADHGDNAGHLGLYDKGTRVYTRTVTRAPLIVRPAPGRFPEAVRDRVFTEPVELVDIFPTACGLCGLEVPGAVEGADLSGVLLGAESLDAGRPAVCEDYSRKMIAGDGWEMVFDIHGPRECSLVHRKGDPGGHVNLYGDDVYRDRRVGLKRQLFAFLMQRLHGRHAEADADRIREALDPGHSALPLCAKKSALSRTVSFRAAALVFHGGRQLLVPFFDEPMLLFPEGNYHTRDRALPFDVRLAEEMLDLALHEAITRIHPISVLESPSVADGGAS